MTTATHMQKLRIFLIEAFLDERPDMRGIKIPSDEEQQRRLLRGLMNTRQSGLPSEEVLAAQDEYLQLRIAENGITHLVDLSPISADEPHIYIWRGDITTLECDAIVNAANSNMTGCWGANHICIDNCIHTFAGIQLRWECARIIEHQGFPEPTGHAKITDAYNLPAKRVIHTVGPIANGAPTNEHCQQLASCYRACYELAKENGLQSIAYCSISTGVFGFPQKEAANIAIKTVRALQAADATPLDVIFNVFSAKDEAIYRELV